jgi:exopolysaccharide production protein ExoQ
MTAPQLLAHRAGHRSDTAGRPARHERPLLPALATAWIAVVLFSIYTFDFAGNLARLLPFAGMGLLLLAPRATLRRVPLPLTGLAFLAWTLLSYAFARNTATWLLRVQVDVPNWIALVAVFAIAPPESIRRGILLAVYGMYGFVLAQAATGLPSAVDSPRGVPYPGEVLRWHGPFYEKNGLGAFVVIGTIALLTLDTPGWRRRLGLAAGGLILLGSFSTTAIFGVIAAVGLAAAARTYARILDRRSRQLFVLVAGVSSGVGAVLSITLLPAITQLFGKDPTLTGRTDIWAAGLEAFRASPITGSGIGFWNARTDPMVGMLNHRIGYDVGHAHNGILNLGVELGVVGIVLFLALFAGVIATAWRARHRAPQLARFTLLYAATITLMSLSESLFQGVHIGVLLALQTALLLAAPAPTRLRHRSASASSATGPIP